MTDVLAAEVARTVLAECVCGALRAAVTEAAIDEISHDAAARRKSAPAAAPAECDAETFPGDIPPAQRFDLSRADAEFILKRFPASYFRNERAVKRAVAEAWRQERAEVIANLRRYGKAALPGSRLKPGLDLAASVMPSETMWATRLLRNLTPVLRKALLDAAKTSHARYGFEGVFNVQSPYVARWLKTYLPKLSGVVAKEDRAQIMAALREGISAGEGIGDLTSRVAEVFDDWEDRYRSYRIARTETIRASNEGALESYRQSGVVEAKEWGANPTACDFCAELDGTVIGLEEDFIPKGGSITVADGDQTRTMTNNYADVTGPPAHPNCMCYLAPVITEISPGAGEEE